MGLRKSKRVTVPSEPDPNALEAAKAMFKQKSAENLPLDPVKPQPRRPSPPRRVTSPRLVVRRESLPLVQNLSIESKPSIRPSTSHGSSPNPPSISFTGQGVSKPLHTGAGSSSSIALPTTAQIAAASVAQLVTTHLQPPGLDFEGRSLSRGSVSSLESDDRETPVRHFKTTMRKTKTKNEFNEDKPWKHHVDLGYISQQERKRYDGVWVSNKGLYLDTIAYRFIDEDDMAHDEAFIKGDLMVAPVVRDLWERSQLSPDTLSSIWKLVDYRRDGTMERTAFIVGMWLIDQCLYGKKLPREVSQKVWNSASAFGVVITKKKGRLSRSGK